MARVYCECGTELVIMDTISKDIGDLHYIVELCQSCLPPWNIIKNPWNDYPEIEKPVIVELDTGQIIIAFITNDFCGGNYWAFELTEGRGIERLKDNVIRWRSLPK